MSSSAMRRAPARLLVPWLVVGGRPAGRLMGPQPGSCTSGGVAAAGAAEGLAVGALGRWPSCGRRRGFCSIPSDVEHRLQELISPSVCSLLGTQGFAVVDGMLGKELSGQLRAEILALKDTHLFHLNSTHLVKDGQTHTLEKQNIWEAEAMAADVQAAAPAFSSLQKDTTLMTLLSLHLPHLCLASQALKLQYNSGGAFPIHNDSDELVDSRRITAIFYLNPSWQTGDGGELRLYPFPLSAEPIDIPPVNDRLVLFSSTNMPHRVLPSSSGVDRCCFTNWLSQTQRSTRTLDPSAAAINHQSADEMTAGQASDFLLSPRVRKHFVKLMYDSEWQRSLRESHEDSAALSQVVETHRQEVSLIREKLTPYLQAAGCTKDGNFLGAEAEMASALMAQTDGNVRWL